MKHWSYSEDLCLLKQVLSGKEINKAFVPGRSSDGVQMRYHTLRKKKITTLQAVAAHYPAELVEKVFSNFSTETKGSDYLPIIKLNARFGGVVLMTELAKWGFEVDYETAQDLSKQWR